MQDQTPNSEIRPRIPLRPPNSALYMPGLVVRRHNPALKIFGDRLSAAGLAPKAVVGAVMRKLAHLIYGVIKSGRPFDLNIATAQLDF